MNVFRLATGRRGFATTTSGATESSATHWKSFSGSYGGFFRMTGANTALDAVCSMTV